jgi:hypothetical protein
VFQLVRLLGFLSSYDPIMGVARMLATCAPVDTAVRSTAVVGGVPPVRKPKHPSPKPTAAAIAAADEKSACALHGSICEAMSLDARHTERTSVPRFITATLPPNSGCLISFRMETNGTKFKLVLLRAW